MCYLTLASKRFVFSSIFEDRSFLQFTYISFLSIAMIKDGESLRNETNEKGRISSLAGNFDKEILGESDVETLLD